MKKVESVWADITAKNEAYKQKFSKQEKVDLSETEKVALSKINELKEAIDAYNNIEDEAKTLYRYYRDRIEIYNKEAKKIMSLSNDAQRLSRDVIKIGGEVYDIAQKLKRDLKELGISEGDVKDSKAFKDADVISSAAQNLSSDMQEVANTKPLTIIR